MESHEDNVSVDEMEANTMMDTDENFENTITYEDSNNEEDDYEDDEEEEEDNESYNIKFYGEMDPLDFALNNSYNGVEIYQQFERLEYEALAEKKRKAPSNSQNHDEQAKKLKEDIEGAARDIVDEYIYSGRRSRRSKRKGMKSERRKRPKSNLNPEIARKIGDATLYYASGNYDEAVTLLEEIVRISPFTHDAYYMLGNIYDSKGDKPKAMNFYLIAAHLSPKNPSLWEKLVDWSMKQNNSGQLKYCLQKAINANPEDMALRFDLASRYFKVGEYQKAANLYSQIVSLRPDNILAREWAAKMYNKCGKPEMAISILEDFVNDNYSKAGRTVDLLINLYIENENYTKALYHIDNALPYREENKLSLHLKGTVCHAYLGNLEYAEFVLKSMQMDEAERNPNTITEVGDSLVKLGHYDYSLKFYSILEQIPLDDRAGLHLKIAKNYLSMKDRGKAIQYFYKALSEAEDDIDARLTLFNLLLEDGKEDEAIILLSNSTNSESNLSHGSESSNPWWLNGKVKMHLGKIYRKKGMLEAFVNTVRPIIHKTLLIEAMQQRAKKRKTNKKKNLPMSVISERAKLLDDQQGATFFKKWKPLANNSDLSKAARAVKIRAKKKALKEKIRAATLAAGMDWNSDDSEEEALLQKPTEAPPLPRLLQHEENHHFIVDLCRTLLSLQRYEESLEIINLTLKLGESSISAGNKEELRTLGAKIAYNTRDPKHGYNYARYIVRTHPYSIGAWNCYYKVVSRLEFRLSPHQKFMLRTRHKLPNCVPPIIISGNQFTATRQHQAAAREYLEAYKLDPENPLINLCVGTALVNLALGHRLHQKHRCILQAMAFFCNYQRICKNSQECLYNIARAYHHVGLVTLAVTYYEKVLSIEQKDLPLPKLPNESSTAVLGTQDSGYCNLQREAAYNVHLIYKKSGAVDLARQILKNYCIP